MSFVSPHLLWGLVLIPLLLGGYVLLQRRRMRYALRFTNVDLLANVVAESPRWRRHVPTGIFLLALTALLVAMARPQLVTEVPREEATVVLAMDVSGSMQATDVSPTRLSAAQGAANRFLDRVPEELRVGLVLFSSEAQVTVPPTADHALVRDALRRLVAEGGTAIGDAVALATDLKTSAAGQAQLASDEPADENGEPPLVVLLLSDGAPSPETLDPMEAAREAKAAGVPVYTVALGTDEGTVEAVDELGFTQTIPVPPDRETLAQISRITGAATFSAPTEQALDAVYDRLGSSIGYEEELREVTYAFAAGGLVLLLVAGSLSALWFNRLP
jgi:Ca-activated chloride channel family protein